MGGLLFSGYRIAVWDDEDILGMDGVLIAKKNVNALSGLDCTLDNG